MTNKKDDFIDVLMSESKLKGDIIKLKAENDNLKIEIEKAIENQILKAKKSITDYQDDVQKEIVDDIILHLNNLKKELLHSEKSVPVSESVSDESLSGISGSQVNTCLSEKCERCQIYEKVINDIYNHLKRCDE